MLRVGLTGELGSGKSTVARLLAARGAIVLSSDEMGRAIVERFGPGILLADGQLNRPELARLAFDPLHPRVEELNAIVHPAVLAEQERLLAEIARTQLDAIVVIESALIFTTAHAGNEPWRKRFDRIVLVTAPDHLKLQRSVKRATAGRVLSPSEQEAVRADAKARLAAQRIPESCARECLVIENTGSEEALARRTEELFRQLRPQADDVQH